MALAIRRHHANRLRRKRKLYATVKNRKGYTWDTPCTCSCSMCRNPRHFDGPDKLTIAEKRFQCVEVEE